jgi:predicted ABC-type transport system involved in lysophospholipase L1 biosynthesis ATPase subunit
METIPAVNQVEATRAAFAASAVIRVEDAHKYYELGETRVHALRGVGIEIHRGEFVAIMGQAAVANPPS